MHISVLLNPKQESDRITVFYESLGTSGHHIRLVYNQTDLVDQEEVPSLENLRVPAHLVRLVNEIIFVDKKGKEYELYKRVNNIMERRSS